MARKSYIAANRDLAYKVWRECGQNIEMTLRELRKHPEGFPLSKPTLYDWIETYNWKERATRAELEEQKANDAKLTAEDKALAVLSRVIDKLDKQIDTSEGMEIDAQKLFAFRNVVKTFMDLKAAMSKAESLSEADGTGIPSEITVTVTRPKANTGAN